MTKEEREREKAERLAGALRANLRRRKAGGVVDLSPPREDER